MRSLQPPLPPIDAIPRLSRRSFVVAFGVGILQSCARQNNPPSEGSARRRIVSLTPNTTEALFALGAGDLVVGRSRYCDYPPQASALPSVGGYVDPCFEAIFALRPDLIVGARGPSGSSISERLAQPGVDVYFPITESVSGVEEMLQGLGKRIDRAPEANQAIAAIEARLASMSVPIIHGPKPRVLMVFGLSPIVAAGPGCLADEMLRRTGVSNAIASGPPYPSLSIESVFAIDPDIIVDASSAQGHGTAHINERKGAWASVRAVHQARVATISDSVVLRPGPRIADGIASLATALQTIG